MSTKTGKKVLISLDVLNSMATQRAILTSSIDELRNQTFRLDDIIITSREKQGVVPNLGNVSDNVNFVKAKYINVETKRSFIIPIRGLLSVQVAKLAVDAAATGKNAKQSTFVKGETPTYTVSEHIVETAVGTEMALPAEFTVVSAENRKALVGQLPVYPMYYYKAYAEKVAQFEKDGLPIADIYKDRAFMDGLQDSELSPRYKNAEAVKEIVITI